VLGHERLELADELGVTAEGEICFDTILDRRQARLLQPPRRDPRERLVGNVGERRTAPEVERVAQQLGRLRRIGEPCVREQPLEAQDVDALPFGAEQIARRLRHERPLREHPPEPRHVDLDGLCRRRRRPLGPELVDQPLARGHAVGIERQEREQRPLLRAPERHRLAPRAHLE